MRYVRGADVAKAKRAVRGLLSYAHIHHSGSLRGMQKMYDWPLAGQVMIKGFVYNIGRANVQKLRDAGVLRGEKK